MHPHTVKNTTLLKVLAKSLAGVCGAVQILYQQVVSYLREEKGEGGREGKREGGKRFREG